MVTVIYRTINYTTVAATATCSGETRTSSDKDNSLESCQQEEMATWQRREYVGLQLVRDITPFIYIY